MTAPTTENANTSYDYGYGSGSGWNDVSSFCRGYPVTRDSLGNPTSYRDAISMTWSGRQMMSAKHPYRSSETAQYEYGADGLRLKKTYAGVTTTYEYANGQLLAEKRSNGIVLHYTYDSLGALSSLRYTAADGTTTTYYVRCNHAGDVEQIYHTDGTLAARYSYDAWGQTVRVKNANGVTITDANHIANVNPIRYRGYYYDAETDFYYVQSRYYDPVVGRWINADSQLNTSLGILGLNQFSYCLNNPVNMVDYGGNKPGDLFDTMDEAARDFAEYINAKSIENNREYASYIYTKTVTETRATTYINPNILGNTPLSWLWNVIFGGGLTKTVTTKVKVTKYTYREPKRGTVDSSSPPINWFGIHTVVGRLHTHAAYDPSYANDVFSPTDKRNAERQGVPTYVATPLGTLRKYDPFNGTDIVLFNDIPFDPNHPGRWH